MSQLLNVLSSIPGLLLTIAPAWYMFAGGRAPTLYAESSTVEKMMVVVPLLIAELAQQPLRSSLYNASESIDLGIIIVSLFTLSVAIVTNRYRIVNTCLDTLLAIDGIKLCLALPSITSFRGIIFPVVFLTIKIGFFLAPQLWYAVVQLFKGNSALAGSINSLWQSPFRIWSAEDISELGAEFTSGSLHHRYNQNWALNDQKTSRFAVLLATLSTIKWDIILLLLVRFIFAVTTLSQPRIVRQIILISEQDEGTTLQHSRSIGLIVVLVLHMAVRQALTRLMNRVVVFVRGILVGQIQSKTLRLIAQDARDKSPATLMNSDMDQMTESIPDLLELAAVAFEVGASMSDLRRTMPRAAVPILFWAICGFLLPYIMFPRLATQQAAWGKAIKSRCAENVQVMLQARLVKMIGIEVVVQKYIMKVYDHELDRFKHFRRTHAWNMMFLGFFQKPMMYFALSCAIIWTEQTSLPKPSFLFPGLLQVIAITERFTVINRTYQRYQGFIACYDQLRAFLSAREAQDEIADQQLILIQLNHCLINDLSVLPGHQHINMHQRVPRNQDQMQLANTSVTLRGSNVPIFNHFSVSIPHGRLTVVMGATASGKSQFLKVLLNEVTRTTGQLYIEPGTAMAYCGQDIWLLHNSIRNNIVADNEFNRHRYIDVVKRCQLSEDMASLPHGDETLLGGGGTRLTNSQQYKIALARMAYSNAPLVLIDDLLSFLDSQTAIRIFTSLLGPNGLLRQQGRTIVLATRLRYHMADADLAIFLDGNGHVITRDAGEMFSLPPLLRSIVEQLTGAHVIPTFNTALEDNEEHSREIPVPRVDDRAAVADVDDQSEQKITSTFMKLVPRGFYFGVILPTLIAAAIGRCPDIFALYALQGNPESRMNLVVFATLSLCASLSALWLFMYYFQNFIPTLLSRVHRAVLSTAINADLFYLAKTEFSGPADQLNQHLTTSGKYLSIVSLQLMFFCSCILVDAVVVASLPGFAMPMLLCISGLVYLIQKYYIPSCDRLQLREQESKHSLLIYHTDIAKGVEQIRASQQQLTALSRALDLLDKSQMNLYLHLDSRRWAEFMVYLFTGGAIAAVSALSCLQITDAATVGLAAFIIQSSSLNALLTVEWISKIKGFKPSLVHLLEFIDNTPVESTILPPGAASFWFEKGSIELQNVTSIYKQETADRVAVTDMSLRLKIGQKVVLEGPTGSGKSSFILTVLNFLDYQGTILVGGVDIMTIPKHQLRLRISTLPDRFLQLPGTVEQNLMPWRLSEDEENNIDADTLQKVLEDLNIRDCLQNFGGLGIPMDKVELSEGERAQFSIARLVLHHIQYKNTIVLMDDPLAKLDSTMRTKMADLVHEYFGKSTVLIACKDASVFYNLDAVHLLHNGRIYESAEMEPETVEVEDGPEGE